MKLFRRRAQIEELRAEVEHLKGISDQYFDLKNPPASLMYSGSRKSLTNEYQQLPIVFAAVNAIARRAASVTPVFYRGDTDVTIDSHPAIDRLMRPRFGWTWDQWVQAWVIQKKIYGEFLVVKNREVDQGVPQSLDNIQYGVYRPDYRGERFRGWIVRESFYDHADVIFDKYPNPWDDVRGMSPLSTARISTETEWSARRFNKRFFDNDATPGGYFKAPNGLSSDQRQRLKHELIESKRGSDSAHSWLLLEGDTSVEEMGLSHKDAQFVEQFGLTLHDICAVMGVDPAVIGWEKESKYASAKEARRYLWTDAVLPALSDIESVLNNQYLSPYNIQVHFDTEGIEALQDNVHETIKSAESLWKMGVPFNMINERFDLGFEDIPGGDEPRQSESARLPQLSIDAPARKEMIIGPPLREGFVEQDEAQKAVNHMHWKNANDEVASLVSGLSRKLRRYFFDVKKKLEKKLKAHEPTVKSISEDDISEVITTSKLSEILGEFIRLSAGIGWRQITGQYVEADAPQEVLNVVARRISMVKEIVQNAQNEVARVIDSSLRDLTQRAIEEGWTEQQMTDAISESLDHAIDNLQSRARTIARSEVHAAHAEARHEAMIETEPVAKRWVASPGENTRQHHIDAMNEGVIPFTDTFKSTGLQYPMEPGGAAEEVINCRCILVPIYEGEK